MAHYTGLRPTVTVSFREPVHAVIQKQEELEIEMTASHYRFQGILYPAGITLMGHGSGKSLKSCFLGLFCIALAMRFNHRKV